MLKKCRRQEVRSHVAAASARRRWQALAARWHEMAVAGDVVCTWSPPHCWRSREDNPIYHDFYLAEDKRSREKLAHPRRGYTDCVVELVRTRANNGIVISGLPANLAKYNATYAPTGALVVGYPAFAAGPDKHLFRHPEFGSWILQPRTFDPTTPTGVAHVPSVAGPVPTWTPALRRLTYLYPTFNHIMRPYYCRIHDFAT